MSKISNLIDFYNGKQKVTSKSSNKDKIPGNSKKFTGNGIMDYPKTRKKEISQLTTLSNSDINLICNTLKIPLKGVFMKDEFKLPLQDGYYIMNLQDSHENGSHWVAFVKIKSNVYYHDSYAVIMPQNQYDLFKSEQINIYYNTLQKQSLDTTSCGWWSIYFLYYMHYSKGTLTKRFSNFNKMFEHKTNEHVDLKMNKNEALLLKIFKEIYFS
jgi:hypothetical protein